MGWWRLYQYNINIMKAYWPPTVTLVYPFLIFLNSSESSILRGVTEMGEGVGGAIPLTITCKWGKKKIQKNIPTKWSNNCTLKSTCTLW
jgi:hypothetical protein